MPSLPSGVIEHYEALRAGVLGERPGQDLGWAVFSRRGLLAWSCALEDSPCREDSAARTPMSQPSPAHLNRCLIQVLATMVLQLQREVTDGC